MYEYVHPSVVTPFHPSLECGLSFTVYIYFLIVWWNEWCLSAIVTLKHGEEAELAVSELSGVPLLGCCVQVSLYRGDNLLCVTALPPTLCSDDAAFRTFAETFGPVEKCFLMRYSSGLCFCAFICCSVTHLFVIILLALNFYLTLNFLNLYVALTYA